MKIQQLSLVALSFAVLASACSDDGATNNATANNTVDDTPLDERDQYVTFDLGSGVAEGTNTPALTDSYWVYDPMTAFTRIDIHGTVPSWDDVQVKINIPLKELGTYSDEPDEDSQIADDLVIIFQKDDTDYVLVPKAWTAEIESYDAATDTIAGTFSGDFWEWDDAFYSAIVSVPPAERTAASVTNGRFKVQWGMRNGSNSEKW